MVITILLRLQIIHLDNILQLLHNNKANDAKGHFEK